MVDEIDAAVSDDGPPDMVDSGSEDDTPAPPKPHSVHKEDRDLKAEARSLRHLLTHHPKNKYCEVCKVAKLTRRPAKRNKAKPDDRPTQFGKIGNADYIVAQSKESMD